MPNQTEIRQNITDRIVEALTSGTLPPWRKRWRPDPNSGWPTNVVSKNRYRGVNPLLLEITAMDRGCRSKWWASYRQFRELGGQVREARRALASAFIKPSTRKRRMDFGLPQE